MFDEVFRELEELEQGIEVKVQLPADGQGNLDRKCPSKPCQAEFKIAEDDWSSELFGDFAYCPICRFEADSDEWLTDEQERYVEDFGRQILENRIDQAFARGAQQFNSRQSNNDIIRLSLSYECSPATVLIPVSFLDAMRQQSSCERCKCRYSSIGSAFFCPACGHNSASTMFDGALMCVRRSVEMLPEIITAVTVAADADLAKDSARHFCETSLIRLVSCFQRFAEAMFDALPNRSNFNPRRNIFQNLRDSSELWRAATNNGYEQMLATDELQDLRRLFQQRHVLSHKDGIVDEEYRLNSGDTTYQAGQRLVVGVESIQTLAVILAKLAGEIRRLL